MLIARLNRGPDRIQAMGFSVCDGELCFRGIKVGMDWKNAQRLSLGTEKLCDARIFDIGDPLKRANIGVWPSDDKTTVQEIMFAGSHQYHGLTAADLLQYFGYPCHVILKGDKTGIFGAVLAYPKLIAGVFLKGTRISMDSQVYQIRIVATEKLQQCPKDPMHEADPWLGFTSIDVYIAGYRRALR
jgi:hypothetical protein